MFTLRRALRWLFGLTGLALGITAAVSTIWARKMIAPERQQVRRTPQSRGLRFEDVQFPARDGVRLSGWFVPASEPAAKDGATVILVHGWEWNRHGYAADDLLANLTGSLSVDLLRIVSDLAADGFNVLTFDLRNHGQSATAHPMTFGQSEAKDLLGAIAYLVSREDVNPERIGAMGFSIGANALLFALPQTASVRAAIAVQPMTPAVFTKRATHSMFSLFGYLIDASSQLVYRLFGGPRLAGILPAFAASGCGDLPVLYVQGTGDEWGSVEDVSVMADMTPGTEQLLFVNSYDRFGGYDYLMDHSAVALGFFNRHLC